MWLALLLLSAEPDTVAATVNGTVIRLADVDALLARYKPPGPITVEQTKLLRQAVLDELIDEALMDQYLAKHARPADAAEVEQHIAALTEAQKKQGKTLRDFTRETGITETRLRASFDGMIRWRKLVEGRVKEKDFQDYFATHREVFEGATVRLSHIVLRVGSKATDGEVTAATAMLGALKADIEAGRVTFAAAARKHSICPTASQGGDLGVIGRRDGQVEENIAAVAFALKINELSSPVRSPAGLHLLMVTARTPGKPTTYDKCTEAVKEAYADEARMRLVSEMRKSADVRISLP